MATYSIEDYELALNTTLTELKVIVKSDKSVLTTFDLATARRLQCASGNYDIQTTEMPSGFYQLFDYTEDDSLAFTDTEGLGISDLRTVRSSFTYHLDQCPIVMQHIDSKLKVQSACESPCEAPLEDCCTIEEI